MSILANLDLDNVEEFSFAPSSADAALSFAPEQGEAASSSFWPPSRGSSIGSRGLDFLGPDGLENDDDDWNLDSGYYPDISGARIDDDDDLGSTAEVGDPLSGLFGLDLAFLEDDAWAGLEENEGSSSLFTMTPWDVLLSCFPDVDHEKLSRILEGNNFHLPSTLDELYNEAPPKAADQQQQMKPKRAICRYALAGHCARSDCAFDHQLSNFLCRFFLSPTGCLKGDSCEFIHDQLPEISSASKGKGSSEPKPAPRKADLNSLDDFPDLGGGSKTKTPKQPAIPATQFVYGPKEFARATKKNPPAAAVAAAPKREPAYQPSVDRRAKKVDDLAWKATGADVSRLYMETRKRAFEQAAARNRFFQLAAELYRSGAKAEAARMASRGRELNDYVQELHNEAAAKILRARYVNSLEIDTHGLHPQEAVYAVQDRLQDLHDRKITGTLKVIVGTGNHSARGLQLEQAIERYLQGQRMRFARGTMKDKKGGILLVSVT